MEFVVFLEQGERNPPPPCHDCQRSRRMVERVVGGVENWRAGDKRRARR